MPGTRKLGRPTDQRKAMLRGMVTLLLENGQVVTTVTRAKELRSIADKMITDGRIDKFVVERYASYQSGIGKKIVDGTATMAELESYALNMGDVTTNISGKQEYLESVMNSIMF